MTYREVLDWVIRHSINGEFLNIIEVPKEGNECGGQNYEWWMQMFGALPDEPLAEGIYLYFYTSQINDNIDDNFGHVVEPDKSLRLFVNGYDWINFYKLEDGI